MTPGPVKEGGRSVEVRLGTRSQVSYYRLSGPQEAGLGKKSLMDDFWLPKVSGALGTGKKGGKNPSQFQHVVGYRHLLFSFHETLALQIEGVKPSEQRRKNFPQV